MQASKVVSEINELIAKHGDYELIGYAHGKDYAIDTIEFNEDDGGVILLDMTRVAGQ